MRHLAHYHMEDLPLPVIRTIICRGYLNGVDQSHLVATSACMSSILIPLPLSAEQKRLIAECRRTRQQAFRQCSVCGLIIVVIIIGALLGGYALSTKLEMGTARPIGMTAMNDDEATTCTVAKIEFEFHANHTIPIWWDRVGYNKSAWWQLHRYVYADSATTRDGIRAPTRVPIPVWESDHLGIAMLLSGFPVHTPDDPIGLTWQRDWMRSERVNVTTHRCQIWKRSLEGVSEDQVAQLEWCPPSLFSPCRPISFLLQLLAFHLTVVLLFVLCSCYHHHTRWRIKDGCRTTRAICRTMFRPNVSVLGAPRRHQRRRDTYHGELALQLTDYKRVDIHV